MPISVQKHSLKTCRDAIIFAEITQVNIVLLHSLRKSRGVRINLPYLYAFVIPKKSSIRIVERVFLLTLVVSALPDKFLPCFFLCFFFSSSSSASAARIKSERVLKQVDCLR